MATIQSQQADFFKTVNVVNQPAANFSWYAKMLDTAEFYRYGLMPILITLQTCLGSIACMYVMMNGGNLVELSLCASITMASNAFAIAGAPMKWFLNITLLSLIVNTSLILINIF